MDQIELIDYSQVGEAATVLKLRDGSVLKVSLMIGTIQREGNDPQTGLPNYKVEANPKVRLIESGKGTRTDPSRQRTMGLYQ